MQKDVEQEKQSEPTLSEDRTILQSSLFVVRLLIAEPPDPAQTAYPPLYVPIRSPINQLSGLCPPLSTGTDVTRQIKLYCDMLSLRSENV